MKKAVILLSILVTLQTIYIVKSLNMSAGRYKKVVHKEEEFLLKKLKNLGINVKKITSEEKLSNLFRIDLENARSFYSTANGEFYIFGDVFDTVNKVMLSHDDKEAPTPVQGRVYLTPQKRRDKKSEIEDVEKKMRALNAYREHLLKNE